MRRSIVSMLAIALTLLGLSAAFTSSALAQDGAPNINFTIAKFNCPTDPGNVSLAAGNIPAACDPVQGVAFTVVGPTGDVLATATTGADGMAVVSLPQGIDVTVTEDVTTLQAGFAPRENPITTTVVTEFAGALFINLPVAVQPPTVGVGTAAPTAGGNGVAYLFGFLAAAGLGFAAVRRRGFVA